jgi:uncharacterized membrane protein YidH (DUF202 family)
MPAQHRKWGAAMQAELEHIQPWFQRWQFALGCAGVALFPPRKNSFPQTTMNLTKSIFSTNPKAAALAGLVLALPLLLILAIAAFQIEPLHGLLKAWSTAEDGVRQTTSSFIAMLAAFLLLPVASLITLAPAVRSVRAGNSLSACRVNVPLGIGIMVVFIAILGVVFVDQLPCFLGKPNCD